MWALTGMDEKILETTKKTNCHWARRKAHFFFSNLSTRSPRTYSEICGHWPPICLRPATKASEANFVILVMTSGCTEARLLVSPMSVDRSYNSQVFFLSGLTAFHFPIRTALVFDPPQNKYSCLFCRRSCPSRVGTIEIPSFCGGFALPNCAIVGIMS